jgi:peptidoglycan hydrolase-like protein with peptidoglycan-binding domain
VNLERLRRQALTGSIATTGQPRSPEPAPPSAGSLLHVQKTAGNAAAVELIRRRRRNVAVLPRDGGDDAAPVATAPVKRRTLRRGSTGDDVKELQMKLRNVRERDNDRDARNRARIDGIFGPLTHQDVIDFQTDTGLDADGVAGPRTWDALDSIVPVTPVEENEIHGDDAFQSALALKKAGQYEEALLVFEELALNAQTPERIGPSIVNAAECHQQRGRFGIAVERYEQGLQGRFNQEDLRAEILRKLEMARQNRFLDSPPADPEPVPAGGAPDPGAAGRAGGGITKRAPAKPGDSGPAVDLFKGKLAHLMIGWPPEIVGADTFEDTTSAKTKLFQAAVGLSDTGTADGSTWHALDSFSKEDVSFSIVGPLFGRVRAAFLLSKTDPPSGLTALEGGRDEAAALGLVEVVKNTEALIGQAHHRMSQFDEAITHYTIYLTRNLPNPGHYGFHLELLRKARQREPIGD